MLGDDTGEIKLIYNRLKLSVNSSLKLQRHSDSFTSSKSNLIPLNKIVHQHRMVYKAKTMKRSSSVVIINSEG